MTKTPAPPPDPATAAVKRMRQIGGWPVNAQPTAQQWVVGFRGLHEIQQVIIAQRVLTDSFVASQCLEENHVVLSQVAGDWRTLLEDARAAVERMLRHAHTEHETDGCRECGRREAATRIGLALGILLPIDPVTPG